MTKKKAKPAQQAPKKVLVIYGLNEEGKPRAAKFEEKDFELALKAAEMMKLQTHEGDARKLRKALSKIRPGDIYASGWAAVPQVLWSQYQSLVKKLTGTVPPPQGAPTVTGYPTSHDAIAVGHCVIAPADSAADGYWPAVVTAIDGDMLHLTLRDFPKEKGKRHRTAVALLDPASYANS